MDRPLVLRDCRTIRAVSFRRMDVLIRKRLTFASKAEVVAATVLDKATAPRATERKRFFIAGCLARILSEEVCSDW